MKRLFAVLSAVAVLLLMLGPGAASADVYHVSLDLPSLGVDPSVTDLELEIQLYDNNWSLGDSWANIDNVVLSPETIDFEGLPLGDLGGFDDSLSTSGSVSVLESPSGSGNHVMQILEDPWFLSTLVYRDFYGFTGSVLSFDVEAELAPSDGFWPGDELVFSLLDPSTLDPLVAGFTPGFADVAVVTADGLSVVPAPGACLLAILGFGSAGYGLRKRSISRTRTK
jgi:hypothetical protein